MELFVRFRAFESITEPTAVQRLREQVSERIQRLQKSGKMVDARVFSDTRGGSMLLEATDGAEVQDLLGTEILDNFYVETHPTLSFEELGEFFQREREA